MRRLRSILGRGGRRGYALPVVVLLSFVATLAIASALRIQGQQSLLVQRRIAEYRRHHDMLGAQAVIRYWLSRESSGSLSQKSSQTEPAHRFSLPTGARIRVFVTDGQGLAHVHIGQLPEPKKSLLEIVAWKLRRRPDLTRGVGPEEISINSAPKGVLEAMVETGASFADAVISARSRDPLTRDRLQEVLDEVGIVGEEASDVMRMVTFSSSLWGLRVEMEDQDGVRTFMGFAEARANQQDPSIYQWRELRERADPEDGEAGEIGS